MSTLVFLHFDDARAHGYSTISWGLRALNTDQMQVKTHNRLPYDPIKLEFDPDYVILVPKEKQEALPLTIIT